MVLLVLGLALILSLLVIYIRDYVDIWYKFENSKIVGSDDKIGMVFEKV